MGVVTLFIISGSVVGVLTVIILELAVCVAVLKCILLRKKQRLHAAHACLTPPIYSSGDLVSTYLEPPPAYSFDDSGMADATALLPVTEHAPPPAYDTLQEMPRDSPPIVANLPHTPNHV